MGGFFYLFSKIILQYAKVSYLCINKQQQAMSTSRNQKSAQAKINELEAQRDELLKALEYCREFLYAGGHFDQVEKIAIDKADAAIAKVKGC